MEATIIINTVSSTSSEPQHLLVVGGTFPGKTVDRSCVRFF